MKKKTKKNMKIARYVFFWIFVVTIALSIFTFIVDFFNIFEIPVKTSGLYMILGISTAFAVFWWGLLFTLEKI